MEFFNKFPYTDFHELNLDWVLKMIKELDQEWDEFKVLNTITLAGTWDISKNYPKYAIVEDSGNGYLSIKPVPPGIAISNLDYWLPVGTYASAISALNTRMNTAESNITTLQNNVSTLNGTVSGHTTQIGNLTTLVNTSNVVDGTIICIGDSYLQGYNPDGDTTPWGTYLRTFLGKTSSTLKSYADGGAGFVNPGQSSKRFEDLLTDAVNDSSFNNKDVSLIIFGGGWNDAAVNASAADIDTRIGNCRTIINNNFANAKAVVAFIGAGQYPEGTVTYTTYYNTIHRYGNSAAFNNMSYLNNIGSALKCCGDRLASDGIHPTDVGQQFIAMAIANFIREGDSIGLYQNFSYAASNDIYALTTNETVLVNFYLNHDYNVNFPTYAANGATEILELNLNNLGVKPLMGNAYTCFWTKGMIKTSDNHYYFVDCYTRVHYDGKWHFYPIALSDDHTGFLNLTNVIMFTILPQIVTLPRLFC